MKRLNCFLCVLLWAGAVSGEIPSVITYQGVLRDENGAANGIYDFQFGLWNSQSNGVIVADGVSLFGLSVTNGVFTTLLDFGTNAFSEARWLEVSVRTNGNGPFTTLSPRQPITTTPYALHALTADSAPSAMAAVSDAYRQATNFAILTAELTVSNAVGTPSAYMRSILAATDASEVRQSLDVVSGTEFTNNILGIYNTPLAGFFFGDSITCGASASSFKTTWWSIVASNWGVSPIVTAYSSGGVSDYGLESYPGMSMTNTIIPPFVVFHSPTNVTTNLISFGLCGYNDYRDFGTNANFLDRYPHVLGGTLSWLAIPDNEKIIGQSAAITKHGNWTNDVIYGGSIGLTSATYQDSLSFQVDGASVYVCLVGAATNAGTVSVTIDGVNKGSFILSGGYGNRNFRAGGTNGGALFTVDREPYLLRFAGYDGRHLVNIQITSTTSESNQVCFLWAAGSKPQLSTTWPLVYVGNALRMVSYTNNAGSDLAAVMFNGAIGSLISELRSDGLNVVYVPASTYYDPTTMVSTDGVHPNDLGHAAIAQAFISTKNNRATVSSQSTGSVAEYKSIEISDGQTVAQNGDVRFSKGTEIAWAPKSGTGNGPSILQGTNWQGGIILRAPNSTGTVYRDLIWNGSAAPFLNFLLPPTISPGYFFHFPSMFMATDARQQTVWLDLTNNQSGTAGYTLLGGAVQIDGHGSDTNLLLQFQIKKAGSVTNIMTLTDGGAMSVMAPSGSGGVVSGFGSDNTNETRIRLAHGYSGDHSLDLSGNTIGVSKHSDGTPAELNLNPLGGAIHLGACASGISRMRHGSVTLVAGTSVVNDSFVTTNTLIFLTCQEDGGTPGALRVSSRKPGVSFTIRSSSAADNSVVGFLMVEP
jgi:hypothetical protein